MGANSVPGRFRSPDRPISWRRDGRALTIYSRRDGTKMRLALGSYPKATWPELVDLKITDYCPVGCAFCYQDSTLFGRHASWENLQLVVDRLSSARVFEVAIGGGEPTTHPDFLRLMRAFRYRGVIPNFTTKLPAEVRRLWPELEGVIGGFAYSAETAGQVRSAAHLLRDVPREAVNLHYVMGLGDQRHFEDYLIAAHEVGFRVTLLGYKTTGRGDQVVPEPYHWWINSVDKLVVDGICPDLSIDTPLAYEYDGRMPVGRQLYHTREGAYSMYVDCVALAMGASSFDAAEELQPFDESWVRRYKTL